jgi:hypothetical protein
MKNLYVVIASLAVSSMVFGADFASEAKRLKPNSGKGAPIVERLLEGAEAPELFVGTNIDIVGLKEAKENNDEKAVGDLLANLDQDGTKLAMATVKADQDKGDSAWYLGYYGWGWPSYWGGGLVYLGTVYYTWWVPAITYTYYTYSSYSSWDYVGRVRYRFRW